MVESLNSLTGHPKILSIVITKTKTKAMIIIIITETMTIETLSIIRTIIGINNRIKMG